MRIGQRANNLKTGTVQTIEAIEGKSNGTWVLMSDGKRYRDSAIVCIWADSDDGHDDGGEPIEVGDVIGYENGAVVVNGPMPNITDENRQEFIDSAADGLTEEQATYENPSSEGQDAVRLCSCGCGEILAKKSEFRQGHDQRHKGNLIRALEAGGDEGTAAGKELVRRGWRSQGEVDVRYNRIAKRAARKAAEEASRNRGSAQALPV